MKKQVKVYKGYVPKGESLIGTIRAFLITSNTYHAFGMYQSKKKAKMSLEGDLVKRTITITSEDEEVK